MSLILEALQRADKERTVDHEVPGIDTEHIVTPLLVDDSKKSVITQRKVFIALLMFVVVLLAVVIYLNILDHQAGDAIAVRSVDLEEKEGNILNKNLVRKLTPVSNVRLDKLSYLNSTFESEPTLKSKTKPMRSSNSTKKNKADVNSLYNKAHKEKQVAVQASSLEPKPKTEAITVQDELSTGNDVYGSILFAKQLTSGQQSSIPLLRYTTHGYNAETKTGVVRLNGRKFRTGETVAPELVLLEVAEDYIVLDLNGLLFRLPAATDWGG